MKVENLKHLSYCRQLWWFLAIFKNKLFIFWRMFFKRTGNLKQNISVSKYFSPKTKIRRHSPLYWLLLVMVLYKSTVLWTGYCCNGTVQKHRQEKSNWDTLLVTVAAITTLKNITGGFELWGSQTCISWFNAKLCGNFGVGWSSYTFVWVLLYLTFVCEYPQYKIEQTDCGFELWGWPTCTCSLLIYWESLRLGRWRDITFLGCLL